MAAEVPDEVVRTFAAVGTWDEIPEAIAERFGGLVDTVTLSFPPDTDRDRVQQVVRDVAAIPAEFQERVGAWT